MHRCLVSSFFISLFFFFHEGKRGVLSGTRCGGEGRGDGGEERMILADATRAVD